MHDDADVAFKGTYSSGEINSTTIAQNLSWLDDGPITLGITAGSAAFSYFKSGVLETEDGCPESSGLNHAVALVGYGTYTKTETLGGSTTTTCLTKNKRDCTGSNEFWVYGLCCFETTTAGTTSNVEKGYYIVQNSWGTGYGDNGFIRFEANEGNGICGMNRAVSYMNV